MDHSEGVADGRLSARKGAGGFVASSAARVLTCVSAGIQATMAAIFLVDPPLRGSGAELTNFGRTLVQPEYDVVFYLAGIVFTMALVAVSVRPGKSPGDRAGPSRVLIRPGVVIPAAVGLLAVHLGLLFAARSLRVDGHRVPLTVAFAMMAVLGLTLAAALTGRTTWPEKAPRPTEEELETDLPEGVPPGETGRGPMQRVWRALSVWDFLVLPLLIVLIYIPGWRAEAGRAFIQEFFHHWDFFSMGPALAFHHGAALESEAYVNYGFGWPVLFAALDPIFALSYGHIVLAGVILGIFYYLGVYVLLRLLIPNAFWAVLGAMLVVLITQFSGTNPHETLWRYPSSTWMRTPVDVWLFIALAIHLKSARPISALVAGALVGLALFFQTDTGLYLAAAFGLYWLLVWLSGIERVSWHIPAASAGLGAVCLIAGLATASRGSMFQNGFLEGWLENLLQARSGHTMLPLTTSPGPGTLISFVLITAVYLSVLGNAIAKAVGKRATAPEVVLGTLAFYGLSTMLLFVGRSHPYNLFHVLMPFGVIVGCLGFAWAGNTPTHWVGDAAVSLVFVSFVSSQPFRSYPNLISHLISGAPAEGLCAMKRPRDACGIKPGEKARVEAFRNVAAVMSDLHSGKRSLAVIDKGGPAYFLESNTPPWGRYSNVLSSLLTRRQLQRVGTQLAKDPPDYVLILAPGNVEDLYVDTWGYLRNQVRQYYSLSFRVEQYEVYKRAPE